MRVDVYDRQDRYLYGIGDAQLVRLSHTDELNGEDSLSITTTRRLAGGYRLVWRDHHGRAHEHVCQEPQATHEKGMTLYSDTALNSVCETYCDYVADKRPYGYTYAKALAAALEGTRWEVGTVDQPGTVASGLRFWHTSAREAIKQITDCGGELETDIEVTGSAITARRVGIRAHRGKAGGHRRFEYGRDASSVSKTVYDGVYTACYAYGKSTETEGGGYSAKLTIGSVNGGRDYVEDLAALELYGRPDGRGGKAHRFCVFEDSNCEDAATLMAEAKVYLANRSVPSVTYEADVIDLAQFGREWEAVETGDDCQLVDVTFEPELRCAGRVQRLVTDLLTGAQTVTIGTATKTLADIYSEQKSDVQDAYKDSASYTDMSVSEQGAKFEVMAGEIRAEVADKASKSELSQTAAQIQSTVQEQVDAGVSEAKSYASTTVTQTARDLTIEINRAKSSASSALDAAEDAKDVTDRFVFGPDGLQITGMAGGVQKVATYTSDGFTVDAETCTIGSANGKLTVKDWGYYYEAKSGDVQLWVTDGSKYGGGPHFRARGDGFDIRATNDSFYVSGGNFAFAANSSGVYYVDGNGTSHTIVEKEG